MQELVSSNKDWLDVLVQVLVVVIPVVITWFIRTYVKGSVAEKDVAAIIRLSNAAIDYVENLDKRGALELPPDIKKGGYKLKLAGQWLEGELRRAGVKMTNEEAQQWVSSEFQKRVGDVRMTGAIVEIARAAVVLILDLDQSGLVDMPPEMDRITYLAGLAADWIVAQLAAQGVRISREEALTWARAELLQNLQVQVDRLPTGDRLPELARQAVAFLEGLKTSGKLAVRPSNAGVAIERDVAMAWLLTEAAKQGMAITSDQIAEAVTVALGQ